MSTPLALALAGLLLGLNAVFVAAEFALVGSKRYRLEQAAATGSRAARAALDGARELSVMLAGAQLGITLCTLGLGALAEPAVESLLGPALHAAGLPDAASHAVAFLAALVLVGFLHLVVGEMAPKSWAITDPERAAILLAPPFRAFTAVTRPALRLCNGLANAILRLVKVEPRDQLAEVHGREELRMLLEQSREHGTLAADQQELLSSLLRLQRTTVADVMASIDRLVTVSAGDSAARIEQVSRACGRSRLVVWRGDYVGVVHVRDAVRAVTLGRPATAADLMTPPFTLLGEATVTAAVAAMRAARAQFALVTDGVDTVGFVALEDLLEEVIGEFDDETDPVDTEAVEIAAVPRGRRTR